MIPRGNSVDYSVVVGLGSLSSCLDQYDSSWNDSAMTLNKSFPFPFLILLVPFLVPQSQNAFINTLERSKWTSYFSLDKTVCPHSSALFNKSGSC